MHRDLGEALGPVIVEVAGADIAPVTVGAGGEGVVGVVLVVGQDRGAALGLVGPPERVVGLADRVDQCRRGALIGTGLLDLAVAVEVGLGAQGEGARCAAGSDVRPGRPAQVVVLGQDGAHDAARVSAAGGGASRLAGLGEAAAGVVGPAGRQDRSRWCCRAGSGR